MTGAAVWRGVAGTTPTSPALPEGPCELVPGYSESESRQKLEAIGRALQIYRQDYGLKPVAERKTLADAGLPPYLTVLAQPGHSWSLPDGMETFSISHPRYSCDLDRHCPHFIVTAWGFDVSKLLPVRGEDLVIGGDANFLDPANYYQPTWQHMALRLNGTVDIVTFKFADYLDFLSK